MVDAAWTPAVDGLIVACRIEPSLILRGKGDKNVKCTRTPIGSRMAKSGLAKQGTPRNLRSLAGACCNWSYAVQKCAPWVRPLHKRTSGKGPVGRQCVTLHIA